MSRITPLWVKAETAAKILDMSLTEFLELLDAGALPPANSHGRWEVSKLNEIMRGDAAKPSEDVEF